MEGVFLNLFGGNDGSLIHHSRPRVSLSDLDDRLAFLQATALDQSTVRGYAVGARDYLRFCLIPSHDLPYDPTPLTLARYIAYTSKFIASGLGSRPSVTFELRSADSAGERLNPF
jgi:hypothetical protein